MPGLKKIHLQELLLSDEQVMIPKCSHVGPLMNGQAAAAALEYSSLGGYPVITGEVICHLQMMLSDVHMVKMHC